MATKLQTPTTEHPWEGIEDDPHRLPLEAFLTVIMSRTSKSLRRKITAPYAEKYGLTIFEWRTLSVLGSTKTLKFSDLVNEVAGDKGQVSRAIKQLNERGLVTTNVLGTSWRQGMECSLTKEGRKIYDKVMPEARKSQSMALLSLRKTERLALYKALKRLQAYAEAPNDE